MALNSLFEKIQSSNTRTLGIEDASNKHNNKSSDFRLWAEVATETKPGKNLEPWAQARDSNSAWIVVFLKRYDPEL